MKPVLTSVQGRLVRALIATLPGDGTHKDDNGSSAGNLPSILVESMESISWESLTFTGAKHRLKLHLATPRDDIATIADRLNAREIIVRGHIVAEVRVMHAATQSRDANLSLVVDILTVNDFA